MRKVLISTDSCADLFLHERQDLNISYINLAYIIDNQPQHETFESAEEFYAFYDKLREGATASTTQLNEFELREYFERLTAEWDGDIIHIPLSGGLSGTAGISAQVAEQINAGLSGRKIYVLDSLGATCTQLLLVRHAAELAVQGRTATEIVESAKEYRDHQQIWIMVDDLTHLKRGGRVSGASAAIGTVLKVKPIINLNDKGKLGIVTKAVGRHKAFNTIAAYAEKLGEKLKDQCVTVVHTGRHMVELAEALGEKMSEKFGCTYQNRHVGPVIGVHLGPDAVAVIYQGKPRIPS